MQKIDCRQGEDYMRTIIKQLTDIIALIHLRKSGNIMHKINGPRELIN